MCALLLALFTLGFKVDSQDASPFTIVSIMRLHVQLAARVEIFFLPTSLLLVMIKTLNLYYLLAVQTHTLVLHFMCTLANLFIMTFYHMTIMPFFGATQKWPFRQEVVCLGL